MKKSLLPAVALSLTAFTLPLVSFAQSINNISDLGSFIINTINNVIVPVLFAIAFIVFLWGVFDAFILGASNEEKRKTGMSLILYGLIGFFVMVSVWGLVNLLTGTVSLGNTSGLTGGTPTANFQVGQ